MCLMLESVCVCARTIERTQKSLPGIIKTQGGFRLHRGEPSYQESHYFCQSCRSY